MPTIVYVLNTKGHSSKIWLTKRTYMLGVVLPSCIQINKVVQILGERYVYPEAPRSSSQKAFIYAHPWSNNLHSLCHTWTILSIKNDLWAYIQHTSYFTFFQYLMFCIHDQDNYSIISKLLYTQMILLLVYDLHMWSPLFGHYLFICLFVCPRGFNKVQCTCSQRRVHPSFPVVGENTFRKRVKAPCILDMLDKWVNNR
jgi:hypothetical protein